MNNVNAGIVACVIYSQQSQVSGSCYGARRNRNMLIWIVSEYKGGMRLS